jgi:hypothetical protein
MVNGNRNYYFDTSAFPNVIATSITISFYSEILETKSNDNK